MLELRKHADKSKPRPVIGQEIDGTPVLGPWPLAGVELIGKAPKDHGFSDELVGRGVAEGWMTFTEPTVHSTEGYGRNPVVSGDSIVLRLMNATLTYKVLEAPGRYADGDGFRVSHEYRCKLTSQEEVS